MSKKVVLDAPMDKNEVDIDDRDSRDDLDDRTCIRYDAVWFIRE